jgi:hypothetical protein
VHLAHDLFELCDEMLRLPDRVGVLLPEVSVTRVLTPRDLEVGDGLQRVVRSEEDHQGLYAGVASLGDVLAERARRAEQREAGLVRRGGVDPERGAVAVVLDDLLHEVVPRRAQGVLARLVGAVEDVTKIPAVDREVVHDGR